MNTQKQAPLRITAVRRADGYRCQWPIRFGNEIISGIIARACRATPAAVLARLRAGETIKTRHNEYKAI